MDAFVPRPPPPPPKTWKRRLVYAAATLQVTEGKWLGGVVRGYGLIPPFHSQAQK